MLANERARWEIRPSVSKAWVARAVSAGVVYELFVEVVVSEQGCGKPGRPALRMRQTRGH